jgi:hypothetical protein
VPLEEWKPVEDFPEYLVSSLGQIYNTRQDKLMAKSRTTQGDLKVTMSIGGDRVTRSVRVLVAEAFVAKPVAGRGFHRTAVPDTVIVLDGDQENITSYNLAWRPRWFANRYARQFKVPQPADFEFRPVMNLNTRAIYNNILEAGMREGLLFVDIYKSATTGTNVYPGDSAFVFP